MAREVISKCELMDFIKKEIKVGSSRIIYFEDSPEKISIKRFT